MSRMLRVGFLITATMIAVSGVSAQAPISEPKSKLIGEMVAMMELDKQFPKIIDAMLGEMEKTYPISLNAALEGASTLTDEQKAVIKAQSAQRFVSFSQKFRKRMAEKVDFAKYVREGIYPLYDKMFTEQELKDLIAFYKTPTGQKLLRSLPELMAESNRLSNEKLLPQLFPIIKELVEEEFRQLSPPPTSVKE